MAEATGGPGTVVLHIGEDAGALIIYAPAGLDGTRSRSARGRAVPGSPDTGQSWRRGGGLWRQDGPGFDTMCR